MPSVFLTNFNDKLSQLYCQLGQFRIFAENFTPESTINPGLRIIALAALYCTLLFGRMVLPAVIVLLLLKFKGLILEVKLSPVGARTKLLVQLGMTFTVMLLE
jgi:hypothetical protein